MKNKILSAAVAAAVLAVQGVYANSITLGDLSQVGGGPSTWTYLYTFANSEIHTGDYFTINDFGTAAVAAAPVFPGGLWAFSQALVGPNSLPIAAIDNAGILNATFTWTGGLVNLGAGSVGPFGFSLTSPLGTAFMKLVDYTSLDHIASGPFAGNDSRVIGSVAAPGVAAPDGGSTLALLGVALAGLGLIRRKMVA